MAHFSAIELLDQFEPQLGHQQLVLRVHEVTLSVHEFLALLPGILSLRASTFRLLLAVVDHCP